MAKKAKVSGSVVAGFPSPAEQYQEQSLDLNELLVKRPAASIPPAVAFFSSSTSMLPPSSATPSDFAPSSIASSYDALPIVADAAALRHVVFDHSRGRLNSDMFPDPMHPALAAALSAGALVLAAWTVVGIVRAAIADHEAIAYAAQAALPAYLVALVSVLAACFALSGVPASGRLDIWDAAGRHTVAAFGAVSAAVALAVIRIAICRAAAMLEDARAAVRYVERSI